MAAHSVAVEPTTRPATVSPPLRVLALIPGDGRGASMIAAKRQCQSLRQAGVDLREFYLASRTEPRAVLREWRRLRQEVAEFRPQVIHAHYGTVTCFLAALVRGVPKVVTFRGSDLHPHPSVGPLRRCMGLLLSQIGALWSQSAVCVSPQLRNKLWWNRSRARVVPTGVDLDLFRPLPREEARRALRWPQAERCVLFNAATEPQAKGLALVQEAMKVAEARMGLIRLRVLDGTASPANVPLYLNAADCLAFASRWEGSPNIVKEAMACNLPVATVDVGDVAERLRDVHPSRVVPRDPQALGQAIAAILSLGIRSNGREAVAQFSEQITAQTLKSIYEDVARDAVRP